jgi:hypothetical protein
MLLSFMIQKAVRELGDDLNNRSDLVDLSRRGIEMLLKEYRCS